MTIDPRTIGAVAIIVHLLVRLLKAGKLSEYIPARWRPMVALGLGAVAATVDAVALGTPWDQAALAALFGVAAAVLGHDLGIEALRGGRELGDRSAVTEGTD